MAQVFLNAGLTVMFNQIITASPTTYSQLYVGLFTGLSGTTVPAATATIGSGITEVSGSIYARKAVTFGSAATANVTLSNATTSSSGNTSGSTYITTTGTYTGTIATYAGLVAGMAITIGTGGTKESHIITGLPGSNQIVISGTLTNTQNSAAVVIGDNLPPVSDTFYDGTTFLGTGMKSTGGQVTFGPALGTWTAANGYFIATALTGGTALYAANFADNSSPTLTANDTLAFTPYWLMSN